MAVPTLPVSVTRAGGGNLSAEGAFKAKLSVKFMGIKEVNTQSADLHANDLL